MLSTLVSLCVLPVCLAGDDQAGAIEQALDQNSNLELKDVYLADALDLIGQQTNVKLTIAPSTMDMLPYGEQTKLTATIKNIPLREGLAHLFDPLSLTFSVEGDKVVVEPAPALRRIGRRATWSELDTLKRLRETHIGPPSEAEALIRPFRYELPAVRQPVEQLMEAATGLSNLTANRFLNLATDALGWTWYPEDDTVVITDRDALTRKLLGKRVTFRESQRPLEEVLMRIAREARVPLELSPGVLQALPPQTRQSFSLYGDNVPLYQALEIVSGTTGLQYRVDDGAIEIYHPDQEQPRGAERSGPNQPVVHEVQQTNGNEASRPRIPYVGKAIIATGDPNVSIELFITESDIDDDVNLLRKKYVQRFNEVMRRELLRLSNEQEEPLLRKKP